MLGSGDGTKIPCGIGGVAQAMDVYKPRRLRLFRRLTALFFLLTLGLWAAINSLLFCSTVSDRYRHLPSVWTNNARFMQNTGARSAEKGVGRIRSATTEDIAAWFTGKLSLYPKTVVQSVCPPVNQSKSDAFTTLAAVGVLHLTLTEQPLPDPKVIRYLENVSSLFANTDTVVTHLASMVPSNNPETLALVRSLRGIGVQLVSLASDHIRQHQDEGVVNIIRTLEAADVRWMGLNAKHHEIIVMRGRKVGFLAFCGVQGLCVESSSIPFAPLRYTSKGATTAVEELKEHGVEVIVVLMYWGRENSLFPDETALTIARHLAELGVTLVIGNRPSSVQDHAYFGQTLVLFSLGNLLSSDKVVAFCWQELSQVHHQWKYVESDHCKTVHPNIRQSLLKSEQQTRVYRIGISRGGIAVADYTTLPITVDPSTTGIRRPVVSEHIQWTTACGESDNHCLACEQF